MQENIQRVYFERAWSLLVTYLSVHIQENVLQRVTFERACFGPCFMVGLLGLAVATFRESPRS